MGLTGLLTWSDSCAPAKIQNVLNILFILLVVSFVVYITIIAGGMAAILFGVIIAIPLSVMFMIVPYILSVVLDYMCLVEMVPLAWVTFLGGNAAYIGGIIAMYYNEIGFFKVLHEGHF